MTKTEKDEPAEETSGVDRLREELSKFVSAQVENLAEKAGDKLTDVAGQLTDAADNGGSLPAIGSRILQGDSPLKAFVSEKAKGVKDNVVEKAKSAFGGGKGKRKASGEGSQGEHSRRGQLPRVGAHHVGGQHLTVLPGVVPATEAPPARTAHLPAGGGRQGRRQRSGPSAPQAVLRRSVHRRDDPREQTGPRLLDRYLARTGYASQQTDDSESGTRTANPWHPADEAPAHDYGAHGSFDETSHPRSAQAALARYRGLVSAAATGAVVGLGAVIRRRRLRQPGKRRCSVRRVARGDVMGVVQCQQRGAAAREILRRLRSEQETDVVAAVDPVLHAADEPGGGLVEDQ